jgi:hypothetical protein
MALASSLACQGQQRSQHDQGLPARVQLAPARADLPAVAADDSGGVIEGLAGQRQCGRVEKHLEPLGGRCGSWSIASSTRGFAMPQGDTPYLIRTYALRSQDQDENAHCKRYYAMINLDPSRSRRCTIADLRKRLIGTHPKGAGPRGDSRVFRSSAG